MAQADYDDLITTYDENAIYSVEQDVAKCRLFIGACIRLLRFPRQVQTGRRDAAQTRPHPPGSISCRKLSAGMSSGSLSSGADA